MCIHREVNCALGPSGTMVKSHGACCVCVCVCVSSVCLRLARKKKKKDGVLLQHTTYLFTASVLLGVWDSLFLFSTKTKVYG